MDYWRTPSRRFYVAKNEEYEQLVAKMREKKSLSLNRKRKTSRIDITDSEETTLSKIESAVEDVSITAALTNAIVSGIQFSESYSQCYVSMLCTAPSKDMYLAILTDEFFKMSSLPASCFINKIIRIS